ncbi:MAG: hypothetical protein IJD85_03955 [Oscillospiraceae bacterium]|nr:hypothetical protein [Oscillospiraceae bacterium]
MAKEFVVTFDDVKYSIGWLSFHNPAVFGEGNDDLLNEQNNVLLSKADYLRDVFKAALADEPSETDLRKAEMWINDRNPLGTSSALRNSMNGIFKEMLPEDGSVSADSVEGTRMLADRISVDNSRYPIRGQAITQENYRYVLNDIALLTSMAMSGEEYTRNFDLTADGVRKLPTVGFLDRDNQPISLVADENIVEKRYNPNIDSIHQFGDSLKKPNFFVRLLKNVFSSFGKKVDDYNAEVQRRHDLLEELKKEYTDEYDRKSANLGKCNAAGKLLAQEVEAEKASAAQASRERTSEKELMREQALENGKEIDTTAKTTVPVQLEEQKELTTEAPEMN